MTEFMKLVDQMRAAQKQYFDYSKRGWKPQAKAALIKSKQLEVQVDAKIAVAKGERMSI